MATIQPTILRIGDHTIRFTYSPMANADVGSPIGQPYSDHADRSIEVFGTFGVGGNLKVEGSGNDAVSYRALNDAQGTALDITAAKFEQILEVPALTRPNVTAGDGTTSLTAVITVRRQPHK